ncbi:MAG: ATP-binding protein [bacterium]
MVWRRVSLRVRILVLVGAMASAALAGGLVTVLYMVWLGSVLTSISEKDVVAMRMARELEISLVMQKGFATYYAQDKDPHWLTQLDHYRNGFQHWLTKAMETAVDQEDRRLLERIRDAYLQYDSQRARVIELYSKGFDQEALFVHRSVRNKFLEISDLCESYSMLHEKHMEDARGQISRRADFINDLAMATMPGVVLLAAALGYVLLRQVLEPIRRLATESWTEPAGAPEPDEVKALTRRVRGLMEDVDQTRLQLEQSQEQLVRSEKLALVGKLAAGVAHSIRNPLTSVKMRIFSLERGQGLTPQQREDLSVVSEEIRQIDHILRTFLEFSRPPRLRMERVSPSQLVDGVIHLLRDRFRGYGVELMVERAEPLGEIYVDPDRLKEVLVNLMVNAAEAMGARGGRITIRERRESSASGQALVVLEVEDNGPGIPASIQDKVLQPFFSTKEEGTGLGLSIVARIVEEHGGWLELRSQEGEGATFIIKLPAREEPWVTS